MRIDDLEKTGRTRPGTFKRANADGYAAAGWISAVVFPVNEWAQQRRICDVRARVRLERAREQLPRELGGKAGKAVVRTAAQMNHAGLPCFRGGSGVSQFGCNDVSPHPRIRDYDSTIVICMIQYDRFDMI